MRLFLCAVLLAFSTTSALAASTPKETPDAGILKASQAFFAAWNQHDSKAMASFWAEDATLINPMGQMGHGKAEIEKLFADEQSTVFKASTATLVGMKITRSLGSNMAFCDGDVTVDGAMGPDGTAMPQMKVHMAGIMKKQGSAWVYLDARPYMFAQRPEPMANMGGQH